MERLTKRVEGVGWKVVTTKRVEVVGDRVVLVVRVEWTRKSVESTGRRVAFACRGWGW